MAAGWKMVEVRTGFDWPSMRLPNNSDSEIQQSFNQHVCSGEFKHFRQNSCCIFSWATHFHMKKCNYSQSWSLQARVNKILKWTHYITYHPLPITSKSQQNSKVNPYLILGGVKGVSLLYQLRINWEKKRVQRTYIYIISGNFAGELLIKPSCTKAKYI